ncbi:hypothetical protein ATANTOWER_031923 [Ataeniobius toweri]|uniref:Uncharacterized protein n=1 Tax=Ataeniobius toweri TaxID=208326 RepID=A0ABU7BS70_9TELE|nr:hypothetical protein [Ataeniobius toweri]
MNWSPSSSQHDAATPMLQSTDGVRQVMSSAWLSPDMTLEVQTKTFYYGSIWSKGFCFSCSDDLQGASWQNSSKLPFCSDHSTIRPDWWSALQWKTFWVVLLSPQINTRAPP